MADLPVNPDMMGEKATPRYVFVVDRVAGVMRDIGDVGADKRDLVLRFGLARLSELETYFSSKKADFSGVKAFIFLQIGQDDLSYDAG